jgi:Tol biopolymer transport system component
MSRRFALFIVSGVVGCSLILLSMCVVIALVAPTLIALGASRVDRIAYIDNEQNVQTVDPQGEKRIAITSDASAASPRAYAFPTWSPDSQHIAFIGLSGNRDQHTGGLYASPTNGGNRTTIYESQTEIPFYLYWSPDSQQLSFLVQSGDELALMLGHIDGKSTVRKLDAGVPFYWSWAPDSQSILMHVGGSQRDSSDARVTVLRLQNANAQTLKRSPGEFEAPHYSPDGKAILYAGITDNDDDALYLADGQGNNARAIANYRGQIAFAWSPDGKKIAWLPTALDSQLINEGPIFVSDSAGKNARQLIDENAIAFYWSPDSKQIAYLVLVTSENQDSQFDHSRRADLAVPLAQSAALRLRWRLVNVDDGKARTLVTFVPTDDFIAVLPYFDQYARSITFWSPDSKHFVYTQGESDTEGSVWVADVTGNATPRRIGDGTLAVWSWK